MQNKGAITFFAVVFALVCLYQLSFTVATNRAESKAREYSVNNEAEQQAKELAKGNEVLEGYLFDSISRARESYYLDSINNVVIYNILIDDYTYQECKERELNLGLDLKGRYERCA